MIYDFDKWRANMTLEALQTLEEKWQHIIDTTEDVDVKADYGNDLIRLHILQDGLKEKAVTEFGPQVADFSRESVAVATPANGRILNHS